MASIGLIDQVFHSGSPYYVALALWCFMGLGLFLLSRSMPVPFVWLAGALLGWLFDIMLPEGRAFRLLPGVSLVFALASLILGWIQDRRSPQARAAAIVFVLIIIAATLWSEFNGPRLFHFWYNYDSSDPRLGQMDSQWELLPLLPCLALLWLGRLFNLWQKVALSLGGLWLLGLVFDVLPRISFYFNKLFPLVNYYDNIFIAPVSNFGLLAWLSFYAVASGYNHLFLLWLILVCCFPHGRSRPVADRAGLANIRSRSGGHTPVVEKSVCSQACALAGKSGTGGRP